MEREFVAAIESTYAQDVEGLEALLETFGSQFHPRHYLVLIVKWLLVRFCNLFFLLQFIYLTNTKFGV